MTKRTAFRQHGMYLLEVGIAMVGVALIVVGIGDVTRLYQGRTAVRAAVHEGLRCLYPTDSSCSQFASGSVGQQIDRFNVFVWGDGYQVPQESLSAGASWRAAPVYDVPLQRSTVTSLTISRARDRYVEREVLFPTVAHLPYLVQTVPLPQVRGRDPLRPEFVYPRTNRVMPPALRVPLGGVGGVTRSVPSTDPDDEYDERFLIGSRAFSLADAWPNYREDQRVVRALEQRHTITVPCYQGRLERGDRINWDASERPQPCHHREQSRQLLARGALSVPVMFHVSGRVTTAEPDAIGKVLISLSWEGKTRRLGGRVLSRGSSGNFVVRGAHWSDIHTDAQSTYRADARYDREIELHGTLDLIPIDKQVTLQIFLVSKNGKEIGWRGGELSLFHPRFVFQHERVLCGYSSNPNACVDPVAPLPYSYVEVDATRSVTTRIIGAAQCLQEAPASIEAALNERLSRIKRRIEQGLSVSATRMWVKESIGSAECAPVVERHSCSVPSTGEHLKGCSSDVAPSDVVRQCGAPVLREGRDSIVSVDAKRNDTGTSKRIQSCTGTEIPSCARPYAREVAHAVVEVGDALGRGQLCPTARLIQAPSLAIGPVDVDTCRDRARELEAEYRAQFKVPQNVPIVMVKQTAEPRYAATPPQSQCLPFASISAQSSTPVVCGREVSWAEAATCCEQNNGRCRVELARGAVTEEARGDARTVLLADATRRALDTALVTYPEAVYRRDCGSGDPHCLEIDSALVDNELRAVVSARMTIPLRILRPFGASGVTVEHSADRALESAVLLREARQNPSRGFASLP